MLVSLPVNIQPVHHGAMVFVSLPLVHCCLGRVESRLLEWQRRQAGEPAAGPGQEGAAGAGQLLATGSERGAGWLENGLACPLSRPVSSAGRRLPLPMADLPGGPG